MANKIVQLKDGADNIYPVIPNNSFFVGSSGTDNMLYFDISSWERGLYMLYPASNHAGCFTVEFLVKGDGANTITQIYTAVTTISGNNVTLHAGAWYTYVYARKLIPL